MFIQPWKETIEFLASVVTIFGFLFGLTYVYKIYNRIDISIQGKNIVFTDKIVNIAFPKKDYIDDSYLAEYLEVEEIYSPKKVVKFNYQK